MLTGLGIALMVAMMGGMMWGGHKMMGGHQKQSQKHARSEASSSQVPVAVSSSPVQGVEADPGRHHH